MYTIVYILSSVVGDDLRHSVLKRLIRSNLALTIENASFLYPKTKFFKETITCNKTMNRLMCIVMYI